MSLLANLIRYAKIVRSRRQQFNFVLDAYRGNEKIATQLTEVPNWAKDFLADLTQCTYQKQASGSLNPREDAVEEMYRFEKRAQAALEGVSGLFQDSQILRKAFQQGNDYARETVNSGGQKHPLAVPLRGGVDVPGGLSPQQHAIFTYLLRACDLTAENINKFRANPLTYRLHQIAVNSKLRPPTWGRYKPGGNVEIAKMALEDQTRLAMTLGHEVSGHSLLRNELPTTEYKITNGFEEFIADNNSIYSLRFAAQLAKEEGNTELAEKFTEAANELINNTKHYGTSDQKFSNDQYAAQALNRQIRVVRGTRKNNDKKDLADYFGQHAFYDENLPEQVLGSRTNEITMPDGQKKPFNTWTLEGIPVTPELVDAYHRYLQRLRAAGENVFKPKEKKKKV